MQGTGCRQPAGNQHRCRSGVWLLVAILVAPAAIYLATVIGPYQRERQIAERIMTNGGTVAWEERGPAAIPSSIRTMLPWWQRIQSARFARREIPADLLADLKSLSSLERLYLTQTQIGNSALEQLRNLKNLQWLAINRTDVTDQGLENLRDLTNLRVLCLDDTPVTDAGLEQLQGMILLERLDLNRTYVTDAGLTGLARLTSLKRLGLAETTVTAEGMESLRRTLPDCQIHREP